MPPAEKDHAIEPLVPNKSQFEKSLHLVFGEVRHFIPTIRRCQFSGLAIIRALSLADGGFGVGVASVGRHITRLVVVWTHPQAAPSHHSISSLQCRHFIIDILSNSSEYVNYSFGPLRSEEHTSELQSQSNIV